MFKKLNVMELFDTESEYGKEFTFEYLSDDMIARAEKTLGYKLSASYIELLRKCNGGCIKDDECWVTTIYGIGPEQDSYNGLEEMFENWIEEWEYPNIGIPFGETQSAGHDMYFMDYRRIDASGEPAIVRIENEGDPEDIKMYYVAENLVEFVKMIMNKENIDGKLI